MGEAGSDEFGQFEQKGLRSTSNLDGGGSSGHEGAPEREEESRRRRKKQQQLLLAAAISMPLLLRWGTSKNLTRFLLILLSGVLTLLTTAKAKPTLSFELSKIPGFTQIVERRLQDAMKSYRKYFFK
nr:uncharacterized protein LOC115265234 [Aedes albopictus]